MKRLRIDFAVVLLSFALVCLPQAVTAHTGHVSFAQPSPTSWVNVGADYYVNPGVTHFTTLLSPSLNCRFHLYRIETSGSLTLVASWTLGPTANTAGLYNGTGISEKIRERVNCPGYVGTGMVNYFHG